MKKAVWLIVIVSSILMGILFFQKSSHKVSPEKQNMVITTIYPLYFITKEIAGEAVEVKRLIKPGSEIHSFSPTPVEMVALDRADLLITLGKELEPWTSKLAAATSVKILSLEEGLALIRTGGDHHAEHKEGHHHQGGIDPHVCLDFDNDIKMIQMISDRLGELYPKHKLHFTENASAMQERFKKLQQSYAEGLKQCGKQILLVGHNAFAYLEKHYGFETESIMGVFAHSRPNAAKIAALSEMIKAKELHSLFTYFIESSKSSSQLAADLILTLEPLYTLGNISLGDEKKGEDMLTLLYFDLIQLRKGLECR